MQRGRCEKTELADDKATRQKRVHRKVTQDIYVGTQQRAGARMTGQRAVKSIEESIQPPEQSTCQTKAQSSTECTEQANPEPNEGQLSGSASQ
mmetsp:Transcript_263/g.564  ORF Transcript_263/g.564 Transcript_263/m.564 type:complete len:93 (-) Transcript_263:107-385(-)